MFKSFIALIFIVILGGFIYFSTLNNKTPLSVEQTQPTVSSEKYTPMKIETLSLGKWEQRFSIFESGSQEVVIKSAEFQGNWKPIQAQWIEESLIMNEYTITQESLSGNNLRYTVSRAGKVLYIGETTAFLTSSPFHRFSVDGDNWWFLYSKNIINESNPYKPTAQEQYILVKNGEKVSVEEAFGLTEFDEKIFYFFREKSGDKLSYFFGGNIYTTPFDEIIHDQCCMAAIQNINTSIDGRLTFWAKQGENLTYNTATLSR